MTKYITLTVGKQYNLEYLKRSFSGYTRTQLNGKYQVKDWKNHFDADGIYTGRDEKGDEPLFIYDGWETDIEG